ncbi:diguanylate cyclase domain-containing protein [Gayadomonas joobiniege]|uniref:diguanylate cyclase domain-containing protein n=1 Tax=Gayadomonas joobiniege TaxID=1234606 RepID=UPI0003807DB4|nr:diguanylate cyclase [Gayadomonas joobiniege]
MKLSSTAVPHILIVDDQVINLMILENALNPFYRITTVDSGQKAMDILNTEDKPDLVLLDIQMPDIDGYQVLLHMRQNDETKNIPVIFITGKDAAEDEAVGLELGAMDYITKPFNITVVKARVRNQLALKSKSDLLESLASIDSLTEIPNRRFYNEHLEKEWRRCGRKQVPLSLIMLDIDEFKRYNDNYGHSRGDETLYEVAQAIITTLRRAGDKAARYGGEEFVILLPDANQSDAESVAKNIQRQIKEQAIAHGYSHVSDLVTVSMGVATTIPNNQVEPQTLQEFADQKLYQAKRNGRNQFASGQLD